MYSDQTSKSNSDSNVLIVIKINYELYNMSEEHQISWLLF